MNRRGAIHRALIYDIWIDQGVMNRAPTLVV